VSGRGLRYNPGAMPALDDPALWLRAALLLVAAGVQGFFGFGFGMVSMSVLSLRGDLVHSAGLVNLTGLLLSGWLAVHLRARVLWPLVVRMLPFIGLGVLFGVTALSRADRSLMVSFLGVTVAGISAWNLLSPRLRHTESRTLDVVLGLFGGLLGGAFNTGGPPLVMHLYRRADDPVALKGTIQVLFVTMGLLRLPAAASQGHFSADVLRDAALAAPAVLVGVAVGARLAHRVDPQRFRRAVWAALLLLGIGLVASR